MIFSIEEEDQPLIDYYDVYYGSPPQAQNLAVDIKRIFGNKDIAKFSKSVTRGGSKVNNRDDVARCRHRKISRGNTCSSPQAPKNFKV